MANQSLHFRTSMGNTTKNTTQHKDLRISIFGNSNNITTSTEKHTVMKPRPWPLLSLWVALVLTIFGSPGQLPTSEWPWPNQAPELAEDLGRNSADRLAAAGLGDLLELVQLPENILLWPWWGSHAVGCMYFMYFKQLVYKWWSHSTSQDQNHEIAIDTAVSTRGTQCNQQTCSTKWHPQEENVVESLNFENNVIQQLYLNRASKSLRWGHFHAIDGLRHLKTIPIPPLPNSKHLKTFKKIAIYQTVSIVKLM